MEEQLLRIAAYIIALLVTILLGIIAFNVNRIYARVDHIERDIREEAARLWARVTDHEQRIVRVEVQLEERAAS